jgi:hypothetical protein
VAPDQHGFGLNTTPLLLPYKRERHSADINCKPYLRSSGSAQRGSPDLRTNPMLFSNERAGILPESVERCRLRAALIAKPVGMAFAGTVFFAASVLCTVSAYAAGPAPVDLGIAKYFVILTETGITDVSASAVLGNVGTSPITGAADLLSCTEVTGNILSVDAAGPPPCNRISPASLGRSIGAMETAYTDAASRIPNVTELGAGMIGGLTLSPGTYAWSSDVLINSNLTLMGGRKDVWIFQVAQNVNLANATSILLAGGAKAKNIFWQVAGQVTMGTTSHFQGIVLGKTMIALKTGATITGRLYAQTAVSLEMNMVSKPGG